LQARFAAAVSDERYAAMWGEVVAAVVVIIAVASKPDEIPGATHNRYWDYALAVGIVACVFACARALLHVNGAGGQVLMTTGLGPLTLSRLLGIFLFVWWAVGTGVLTTKSHWSNHSPGAGAAPHPTPRPTTP
jgi:hypothetical protein